MVVMARVGRGRGGSGVKRVERRAHRREREHFRWRCHRSKKVVQAASVKALTTPYLCKD